MTWAWLALAGALAASAAAAQVPSVPRLAGVIVSGSQRIALFEDPPGQVSAFGENEELQGYVLRRIGPGQVELERDGQRFLVQPAPSGQASSGPAPAPMDTGGATFGLAINPPAPAPD